jgi:hypothetical protein
LKETHFAIGATIAFLVAACIAAALLGGCARADATERIDCPLDAVRYKAPAFADEDHPAWSVVDRSAHVGWWLVWVDGGYVVLPVGKELNGDE